MKISKQHRTSPRSGVALVTAVVVLGILMTISYASLSIALSGQKRISASQDDGRAFLLADAGLNEAFEALRNGGTGAIGTQANPAYLGGGVFWVEATEGPAAVGTLNRETIVGAGQTYLEVTAMLGSGRYALGAVVEYDDAESPLFETTLNSKEQLTLNSRVVIDSFDSAVGTYASQAVNSFTTTTSTPRTYTYAGDNGDARSNADIVLNADATVLGDAIPGPSHAVTFANGSFVSGATTPALVPFDFPLLTMPPYPVTGAYNVPNGSSATLPSGNYGYTSFSIQKDATLTITGPAEILVDDFFGGKDANLIIDASAGPVTFHVADTYTHTNGFEADAAPGSPMAVAFLVDGIQDITFPSGSKVRGAYYTPNANILFAGNNECWGAFAGNRIDMSNDMRFHFDEDLMNHWDSDNGSGQDNFEVIAWGEVDIDDNAIRTDRRDPLAMLGVKKSALAKPADLWGMAP